MTTLDGFQHRLVPSNGITMHAVIGGAGSPLVLLHGFPQTWWEWHGIMPALAAHHTVVALDLRGAGHSDSPVAGYEKANLAADVDGVMQALGFPTYAVCGHDIGGMTAVALACTRRDAVTKLAVLDVPLPGWSGWEAIFADPRVWHFGFHMKRDVPEMLLFGREQEYVSSFIFDRAFNMGAHAAEDVAVFARALAQPGNTRGGLEWYRAFPADHAAALVWKQDKPTIPVLALGGAQRYGSRMVPMLQEFATHVSGGSIAECGHWVAEERPAEVTAALLEFLGRP